MKRRNQKKLFFGSGAALLFGLSGALISLADIQTTQVQVLTMQAEVGEAPAGLLPFTQGFQISHQALQGVSLVTKVAIIQGTVGTRLQGFKPDFKQLLEEKIIPSRNLSATSTPSPVPSASPTPAPPGIRVTLRFQFLGPDLTSGPGPIVEQESEIKNEDPTYFIFQIDPSQIRPGVFRYQIIARKWNEKGGIINSASFPKDALSNSNIWAAANVQAGAAPLIGIQGGRLNIPDGNPNDGESIVDVPSGVFKSPTTLTLNEVAVNDRAVPSFNGITPLAVYHLDANPPFSGGVRITVIYPDFMPETNNWIFSGTAIPESQLSLAGWDGFSWRRLGGKVDAKLNTITAGAANYNYLGVFALGPTTPLSFRPPQKIITPNDDTKNDSADFGNIDAKIEIFDIDGHRVRTVMPSLTGSVWDGRDDSGKIVESGVYIYQFSTMGERVSGVIAVAK